MEGPRQQLSPDTLLPIPSLPFPPHITTLPMSQSQHEQDRCFDTQVNKGSPTLGITKRGLGLKTKDLCFGQSSVSSPSTFGCLAGQASVMA